MKGQKDSVVEEVMLQLPTFNKGVDVALNILTSSQLETIKANIMNGIINGLIQYSKVANNHSEVRTYARSMVMNHLNKSKELNPNYVKASKSSSKEKEPTKVGVVDLSLLPDDLRELSEKILSR